MMKHTNLYGYLDQLKVVVLIENSTSFRSPLLGVHGISYFVEARKDSTVMRLLIDVGQNPDALLYNARILGIDLASVNAIVLTHCHYDHTQGLVTILRAIGKKRIPVIAHKDIFRPNFSVEPYLRYTGMSYEDSAEKIAENGGVLLLSRDPVQIMPGLITSGEIPRYFEFEREPTSFRTITSDGRFVEDYMEDEIAVIANVRNEGLVILTGCSHPGICNIIRRAIELTEVKKIKAVIGGFHLMNASEERIKRTVECLAQYDIDLIAAGHCTGFKAQVELYLKFKDKFMTLHAGETFLF